MTVSRFCSAPLLAILLAASATAQTKKADAPGPNCLPEELYPLLNASGPKPDTAAAKQLFQDLREWGEVAALREDIRRARRWMADPEYDPSVKSLLFAIVQTRLRADGKTWDDLRGDGARLYALCAAEKADRTKVKEQCEALQVRLGEVQKPVYARLQALQPPADGGAQREDEKKFLAAVQEQLKEMYDDPCPMTAHERYLVASMRRFEGGRLTSRRAAFWLAAYRAGETK